MKINSHNEWDTLKEVILGTMDGYFPGMEFKKNFKHRNFDKAIKIARSAYPQSYIDEVNEDLNDLKKIFIKNNVKVLRPKKYNSDKIFQHIIGQLLDVIVIMLETSILLLVIK